jgi:hypothetical protein
MAEKMFVFSNWYDPHNDRYRESREKRNSPLHVYVKTILISFPMNCRAHSFGTANARKAKKQKNSVFGFNAYPDLRL